MRKKIFGLIVIITIMILSFFIGTGFMKNPNDTEIFFNRTDGGYELVLVKDEATGQWRRASEIENQQGQVENKETITYNGKEYLISELCDATLQWLELSDQERMLSSYFPPEFVTFVDTWGVSISAENW